MRIRSVVILIGMAFGVSCSTTPDNLEQKASTRTATYAYAENYQEIYRRIVMTAKRCVEGGSATILSTAESKVDGELYSELGYGEIVYYFKSAFVTNYFWKAKIERNGTGARVTVASGNTVNNGMWLDRVKRWADGDGACPII